MKKGAWSKRLKAPVSLVFGNFFFKKGCCLYSNKITTEKLTISVKKIKDSKNAHLQSGKKQFLIC